eukprot:gnl/Carplike_NY0171/16905_a25797_95.p2 GENE.gnl/Carplike_NY0171/16905_a25797_95~~gnl/Carplike_NY0171/16905_a25797_95.p2  ORF type:complete len:112 (-),score=24.45 gnl/Carplike_NY0171/16905_a25797_95:8-304(-)
MVVKRFEFQPPSETYEWYFLSIGEPAVTRCVITGNGTWDNRECKDTCVSRLLFVRDETPEEVAIRTSKEQTISDAQIVYSSFKAVGESCVGFCPPNHW